MNSKNDSPLIWLLALGLLWWGITKDKPATPTPPSVPPVVVPTPAPPDPKPVVPTPKPPPRP